MMKSMNIPKSRINIVGEVNGYVSEMLNGCGAEIANTAKLHNTTVNIAQRGNRVLVNSGNITSTFNLKEMERGSDFVKNIVANIRGNSEIPNKGLKKGFSIIA